MSIPKFSLLNIKSIAIINIKTKKTATTVLEKYTSLMFLLSLYLPRYLASALGKPVVITVANVAITIVYLIQPNSLFVYILIMTTKNIKFKICATTFPTPTIADPLTNDRSILIHHRNEIWTYKHAQPKPFIPTTLFYFDENKTKNPEKIGITYYIMYASPSFFHLCDC